MEPYGTMTQSAISSEDGIATYDTFPFTQQTEGFDGSEIGTQPTETILQGDVVNQHKANDWLVHPLGHGLYPTYHQ